VPKQQAELALYRTNLEDPQRRKPFPTLISKLRREARLPLGSSTGNRELGTNGTGYERSFIDELGHGRTPGAWTAAAQVRLMPAPVGADAYALQNVVQVGHGRRRRVIPAGFQVVSL